MNPREKYERRAQPRANLPDTVSILGVRILNASSIEAIRAIEPLFRRKPAQTNPVYIVNAHTLNLASESAEYRALLNDAYAVFADGTGTRWAARMRGVTLKDNLVGTDLIPKLFEVTSGRGLRYFLLGADARTIRLAANASQRMHPGWQLAGFHHGYVTADSDAAEVIEQINEARPNLLLVGMGNPLQEQWIHRYRHKLQVPVSIGVGGLFDHWGGNLKRAPRWVRQQGFEWLQLMMQQPGKWRRYLIGNPKFLLRTMRLTPAERARLGSLK
jgi:N-acetylglucosaminyldiphosphoundecaprenol N-acetyl-beta-D-mannosaminyltransferase